MRTHYLQQLSELEDLIGKMAGLIVGGFDEVAASLTKKNVAAVKDAANMEQRTDKKLDEIERLCSLLLLTQQPVASDMRFIVSVMNVVVDMERIGDQAEDIAEIISFLDGRPAENDDLMREMAKATIKMVTESVDAYVKHDIMLAEKVVAYDDTVDDYFDQVKRRLITKIAEEPADGEYALDLLMIAKYFERIGDHAVNIAEWVIFSVTGVHKEV